MKKRSSYNDLTESEMDALISKNIEKIPGDVKKLGIFLKFLRFFNRIKKVFKV